MANRHELVAGDILPAPVYAAQRSEWRRKIGEIKRNRRVEVGPYVTFYFESYDTMWLQVQEMVHIEKGGAEQVPGELEAYNPLIPTGDELCATFMIEIDDPDRRHRILGTLGGIEETVFIRIGSDIIRAEAEADQDRTTEEGKASSVQFVHFHFTSAQIAAFSKPGTQVILGLEQQNYGHMAVLSEAIRAELAKDFG
jgi:hypothetical protein